MADAVYNSCFDGNTFQRIGWQVLAFLLTGITLGIAYPWAMCMVERWEIKHTVINGRRLKFTGHGHQLFGRYILWAFLTVITLGIYSVWFGLGMKKWVVKHTVYADDNSGAESRFTGGAGGWFCYHLLFGLIAVVTFGIGIPWGQEMLLRWEAVHTEIGGKGLVFSGTGGQLFVKYLILVLLTPLTLGIYAIFFPVSLLKWQASHTARRNGPASTKGVSKGLVFAGIIGLAAVVVLGGIGLACARVIYVRGQIPDLPGHPAVTSKRPKAEPENRTALSVEEFEQILIGEWSNARREEDMIRIIYYGFPFEGEVRVWDRDYMNKYITGFPGEEGDEYGWFIGPRGYATFFGIYSLTALGDDRFALTVAGSYDVGWDSSDQYTVELTYVDDDSILINGDAYVRGSNYTLAEFAKIFGFDIEVDVMDDPLW